MAEEEQQVVEEEQPYEEVMEQEEDGMQDADELEAMKQKLKELEDEANKLRAQQGGAAGGEGGGEDEAVAEAGSKEEVDARSVFVNNVEFAVTPEELQNHFAQCGTVNRVTVLTDKFGNPKGYAYLEFLEVDAVDNAILLDNSELHGRAIKVSRKRTNVPGLKRGRGRGRGRGGYGYGGGGYGGGGYAPRGRGGYYGYAPRGRGRGRGYAPY